MESELFGNSVAIWGNLAVVGAAYDSPGGLFRSGSAFVFDATTGALVAALHNPAPTEGDSFGNSVAISENLAVVGASYDQPDGVLNAGTAYVFDAMSGALLATLEKPAPKACDGFGSSVAISGRLAVVGAWFDTSASAQAGRAYVFDCLSDRILDYLLGRVDNPAGLDANGDGVVDIADLLKALAP